MSADTLPELRKALEEERDARRKAEEMYHDVQAEFTAGEWVTTGSLRDTIARAELAERELTAWRAETGAGYPEDAGAAIRNTREDLRRAEKERDAERTRREVAEARSAQAERARDNIREASEYWHTAKERAEAGNAALSKHIDTACYLLNLGQVDRAVSYLRKAADHEQPGTALLEYVRALEWVRTAVEPTRRLTELFLASEHGAQATETERALVDACARADALKAKH